MSLTINQIIDAIAPQFSSDPYKQTHIDLAKLRTSLNCFGENYNYAVSLRAAHTLTIANMNSDGVGGSGAVKTKREGELSIGYGSVSGVDGYLSQTNYGIELQGLINGNILGVSVSGEACLPC